MATTTSNWRGVRFICGSLGPFGDCFLGHYPNDGISVNSREKNSVKNLAAAAARIEAGRWINRYKHPEAEGLEARWIMDVVSAITDLQHAKTVGAVQMRVAKKV